MALEIPPPEIPWTEKAAQLIFPGFKFGVDDPAIAERLVDLGVGGFCLYGGSAVEIDAMTRRLQARARLPLLFCADYEDGLAAHVSDGIGLPSNMAIGASGDESLAYQKALLTAIEAKAIGVRWVLAPVLDLATQPSNPIVNVRAFGEAAEAVGRFGAAYMKGLASERVLSCAKHFPGHGETLRDSHLELPILRRTRQELQQAELAPYRAARDAVGSVMMAHLYVPELCGDEKTPTSLSPQAVAILREELGYQGLITTDALNMGAVVGHYGAEEACIAALKAGNDVLLVPADPARVAGGLPQRLEADPGLQNSIERAYGRLMKAKQSCGLWRDRGIEEEGSSEAVGSARRQEAAERMAAACLCWVGGAVAGAASKGAGASGRKGGPGPGKSVSGAIRYFEPEADRPEKWQGLDFVAMLKALGVEVRPYDPAGSGQVIVATFVRPRAYSGLIALQEEEERRARQALAAVPAAILVSFGSPFVFDQLEGWKTGLCAFGAASASQKAAARLLAGKAVATAKMPVRLKCMQINSASW